MAVSKETEEKIQQLQMIEQSLQTLLAQKQSFQMRLMEVESALGELAKTKSAYKIIGNIMISASSEALQQDLGNRKETTELRIKSIEKQERTIREKAATLQQEVLGELKKEEKDE